MIADEVYGHLAFGDKPFVPMGVFGSTVPVLTLGSLSKRWIVPGWRLGWLVISDPNSNFKKPKVLSPSLSLSVSYGYLYSWWDESSILLYLPETVCTLENH